MTAHRYWRISLDAAVASLYGFSEIEFRTTAGTPLPFSGGTASAGQVYASPTYDASKATDGNINTFYASADKTGAQWWAYDYGAGVTKDIVEIKLTARNDSSYDQTPTAFTPQWSDDGSTWTAMSTITTAWVSAGQGQVFAVVASPPGRWIFGDSFDSYAFYSALPGWAVFGDSVNYWDPPGTFAVNLVVQGRSPGRQAVYIASGGTFTKASGRNHQIHHVNLAFYNNYGGFGTNVGPYVQLLDGSTAQCTLGFRQDGAIEFRRGSYNGTLLTTWAAAFPMAVWTAFEFELVIDGAAGSIKGWRNGGTSSNPDFQVTGLNTRSSANNYANKLMLAADSGNTGLYFQDLLWRSDTVAIPWLGDVSCVVRAPSGDAQAQWSKPASYGGQVHPSFLGSQSFSAGNNIFMPIGAAPAGGGTLTGALLYIYQGYNGNLKCALYEGTPGPPVTGGAPTNLVQAAAAPFAMTTTTGIATFTFSPGVVLVPGKYYVIGFCSDTSAGQFFSVNSIFNNYYNYAFSESGTYAAFPKSKSGATAMGLGPMVGWTIAPANNAGPVSDQREDNFWGGYNYSATVNQADLYNIAANPSSTPYTTIAVTTRGLFWKSGQTARKVRMQAKSGGVTVQSPEVTLSQTLPSHAYRLDETDPNTGAAWTAVAVNNLQIGPLLTA